LTDTDKKWAYNRYGIDISSIPIKKMVLTEVFNQNRGHHNCIHPKIMHFMSTFIVTLNIFTALNVVVLHMNMQFVPN